MYWGYYGVIILIHKTKNTQHKIILLIIVVALLVSFFIKPHFYKNLIQETDYSNIIMIASYLPGFFILMGLIEIWLPKKFVVEHLGKHSGVKGSLYSFLLGSLIPGPLYIAFPFAASLLRKGVSRFNIVIFLGAWSYFKLGEEVFELQFLGLRFLILRVLITIPFIVIMAYIIDRVHFKHRRDLNI